MVWLLDLPAHPAMPIHFEDDPAFDAWPCVKPAEAVHGLAAVQQVSIVEQVTVEPGSVRQIPGVHDTPEHVNQVHAAVAKHRTEQCISLLRACSVVRDQTGPRASDFLLIHARHRLACRSYGPSARTADCWKVGSMRRARSGWDAT